MKSKGLLMYRIALLPAFIGTVYADPALQPPISFTQGTGTTWNADWAGIAKRTYFAQGSIDLISWEILPVLEFGAGLKGAGIDTEGTEKYFYRLKYIDADWVTTEQEARDADFDGDGITNWFEVEELFSDPLDKHSAGGDSNFNGLPDGWELYYFGALGLADPNAKLTPDGLTNKEKAELGLGPAGDDLDLAVERIEYSYEGERLERVNYYTRRVFGYGLDRNGNIETITLD